MGRKREETSESVVTEPVKIPFAYDTELMQPGCVLVQAAMGGSVDALQRYFIEEQWLLAPTKNMKLYGIEEKDLERLGKLSKRRDEQAIERKAG